jgi:hypothetical protein
LRKGGIFWSDPPRCRPSGLSATSRTAQPTSNPSMLCRSRNSPFLGKKNYIAMRYNETAKQIKLFHKCSDLVHLYRSKTSQPEIKHLMSNSVHTYFNDEQCFVWFQSILRIRIRKDPQHCSWTGLGSGSHLLLWTTWISKANSLVFLTNTATHGTKKRCQHQHQRFKINTVGRIRIRARFHNRKNFSGSVTPVEI